MREVLTKGAIPLGRYGHATVCDKRTGIVYVHGGYGTNGDHQLEHFNQLYSLNIKTMTW